MKTLSQTLKGEVEMNESQETEVGESERPQVAAEEGGEEQETCMKLEEHDVGKEKEIIK